jgi:hypothetical protein
MPALAPGGRLVQRSVQGWKGHLVIFHTLTALPLLSFPLHIIDPEDLNFGSGVKSFG